MDTMIHHDIHDVAGKIVEATKMLNDFRLKNKDKCDDSKELCKKAEELTNSLIAFHDMIHAKSETMEQKQNGVTAYSQNNGIVKQSDPAISQRRMDTKRDMLDQKIKHEVLKK